MTAAIFDPRPCLLGEGAFWHPLRQQFFWFDILNRKLRSRLGDEAFEWALPVIASAAAWLDGERLLLSTEKGLAILTLESGAWEEIAEVEADNPLTRCNDGRADRQGGFWFSTMGFNAKAGAGTIYRYFKGEIRALFPKITIPNAICFAPEGDLAYFADTAKQQVFTQGLDAAGWPKGAPELFLDQGAAGLNPDGAIIDSAGHFLCAQWGEGAVLRYDPQGRLTDRVEVGGLHSSCPALGGEKLDELLVTTATAGMDAPDQGQGLVYLARTGFTGLAESKVLL